LPLARGSAAHELLHQVLVELRDRSGSARVREATLATALELLDERLVQLATPMSLDPPLERTERHRLRSDLRRYLTLLAAASPTHEPEQFELAFGLEGDPHDPVVIGALELCGRIDRVDIDESAGTAVVIDYKSSSGEPAVKWATGRRFQPALYMRAVEALLGRAAVAGLYQPLRIADQRPRGAVRGDVELGLSVPDRDRLEAAEFDALVDGQIAAALAAADQLTAGEVRGRPQSCSPQGRCRYPAICRCEAR
jgi:RecB family exonuclease